MSDRLWYVLHVTWFRRVFGYALWGWLILLTILVFAICGFYFGVPSRCSDNGCPYQW